ncbi:class I SAM-dependent methyltransferase [Alkaliphilus peptidifermentans]|uniref:Methyltransferase domain-containing protein n=1 Tax=Alkaliphilus peptidifermentans DSM 18978 TaxID=1120976 RepID=A0A1G5LEE7_9FIRM|nr:methyltransferase domain-containing protein [Alkaliphilus peptidifermentans]SCZ10841.1 Methyltransferase domain-containing protein [Alkaliphilus peptidifermentans DSM 18978]
MAFNWINAEEFSFNTFLLMDRWMIRFITKIKWPEFRKDLGIALTHNPSVCWYFINKCPECKDDVYEMLQNLPINLTDEEIRKSEIFVLNEIDSFVVYVYPNIMEQCPYIRDWKEERLLSMVDFKDKVVLDIGSGTGRLAFVAAKLAKWVYASEPVDRLREYMREKIQRLQVKNMFVIDGTVERIPFENDVFDIVMAAHVVGDDYVKEYNEMKRVVKSGGYIIDCMGEDDRKRNAPSEDLIKLGFDYSHYTSISGGDVYRYWKQIIK